MTSNNHIHSDSKKRRSFVALLFAAGDVKRYVRQGSLNWENLFMGGMWFDPETLADSLSETAGYKAGIALSLEAMCDHLSDTDYADLLIESEQYIVRLRSEEYDELFFKLLHRIGYTEEEFNGDYTGSGLFHKYRNTKHEKTHQRVIELFLEHWPRSMEEAKRSGKHSIDPTSFLVGAAAA